MMILRPEAALKSSPNIAGFGRATQGEEFCTEGYFESQSFVRCA
jgi:hypothetical protein